MIGNKSQRGAALNRCALARSRTTKRCAASNLNRSSRNGGRAGVIIRARERHSPAANFFQVAATGDLPGDRLRVSIADLQQRIAVDIDRLARRGCHCSDRDRLRRVRAGDVERLSPTQTDGLAISAVIDDDRSGRGTERGTDRREGIHAKHSELAAGHAEVCIRDRLAVVPREVVVDINRRGCGPLDQHYIVAVAALVVDLVFVAVNVNVRRFGEVRRRGSCLRVVVIDQLDELSCGDRPRRTAETKRRATQIQIAIDHDLIVIGSRCRSGRIHFECHRAGWSEVAGDRHRPWAVPRCNRSHAGNVAGHRATATKSAVGVDGHVRLD